MPKRCSIWGKDGTMWHPATLLMDSLTSSNEDDMDMVQIIWDSRPNKVVSIARNKIRNMEEDWKTSHYLRRSPKKTKMANGTIYSSDMIKEVNIRGKHLHKKESTSLTSRDSDDRRRDLNKDGVTSVSQTTAGWGSRAQSKAWGKPTPSSNQSANALSSSWTTCHNKSSASSASGIIHPSNTTNNTKDKKLQEENLKRDTNKDRVTSVSQKAAGWGSCTQSKGWGKPTPSSSQSANALSSSRFLNSDHNENNNSDTVRQSNTANDIEQQRLHQEEPVGLSTRDSDDRKRGTGEDGLTPIPQTTTGWGIRTQSKGWGKPTASSNHGARAPLSSWNTNLDKSAKTSISQTAPGWGTNTPSISWDKSKNSNENITSDTMRPINTADSFQDQTRQEQTVSLPTSYSDGDKRDMVEVGMKPMLQTTAGWGGRTFSTKWGSTTPSSSWGAKASSNNFSVDKTDKDLEEKGQKRKDKEICSFNQGGKKYCVSKSDISTTADPGYLIEVSEEKSPTEKRTSFNNSFLYPLPFPHTRARKASLPQMVHSEDEFLTYKVSREEFFMRWMWGSQRVIAIDMQYPSHSTIIEKDRMIDGKQCTLICRKFDTNRGHIGKFKISSIRAFYLVETGPGLDKISAKNELENLANFTELEANKAASRLELLVSPASQNSAKEPYQYFFETSDDFEEIPENSNIGCGFIPPETLENLMHKKGIIAIQVRVISPQLGIFKGMLMSKRGIQRIQLPPSMCKVKKACSKTPSFNGVYLLCNGVFPSHKSINIGRYLNPYLDDPAPSSSKELEGPGEMIRHLLEGSVPEEEVDLYCKESKECWERHNHASCVGVADPTDGLPPGTVFVTGMGRGQMDQHVYVTRYPCTERDDGKVIPRITSKPTSMSNEDWIFLCSLHFGVVVFANRKRGDKPQPETIADGDLDGDLYFVCWDNKLLSYLSVPIAKNDEKCQDDDLIGTQVRKLHNRKYKTGIVKKRNENTYIVDFGHDEGVFTRDEIMEGKDFVDSIESHKKKGILTMVKVLWSSGVHTWERLDGLRYEIPETLAEYAEEHSLLKTREWAWAKDYVQEKKLERIEDHRKEGGLAEVMVLWDNQKRSWESLSSLKTEYASALAEYAKTHEKLLKTQGWLWVNSHHEPDWFEETQNFLVDVPHLLDTNRVTQELFYAFNKEKNILEEDSILLGRAYKQSNDIYKHGGKVDLPFHLQRKVPKNLHKYIYLT